MITKSKIYTHLQNAFNEQLEQINEHLLTIDEDVLAKIKYSCEAIDFDYRYVFLKRRDNVIVDVRFMVIQMLSNFGLKPQRIADILRMKERSGVYNALKMNNIYQMDAGYCNRAFLVQFPTPKHISLGRKLIKKNNNKK